MTNDQIFKQVQRNIDMLTEKGVCWSVPVTHEQIVMYTRGNLISLNFFLPPKEWFFEQMRGKKILCLAGAGGQQAPLLASLGAEVTVFDLSEAMLRKDKLVAERESLNLRIAQGNMCDLSIFMNSEFDMVLNPPSLMYVPDVYPVFKECHRVLKPGGILIMSVPNPVNFIFEYDEGTKQYIACNKLPYKSYEHSDQGDWIEYGHTLQDYIGGQISAGFVITGFYENRHGDSFETEFTTRAVKCSEE